MNITITLDDETYRAVRASARRSGRCPAEVVSEMIHEHFDPCHSDHAEEAAEFDPPDGEFPFFSLRSDGGMADIPALRLENEEEGVEKHFELMKRVETLRR